MPPFTLFNTPTLAKPIDPFQCHLHARNACIDPTQYPRQIFSMPPIDPFQYVHWIFLHPHSSENVHRPDYIFYLQTQLDTPPIRRKTYATISTNPTKPQPNQSRKIATSPQEDKERYVEKYMIYYAVV